MTRLLGRVVRGLACALASGCSAGAGWWAITEPWYAFRLAAAAALLIVAVAVQEGAAGPAHQLTVHDVRSPWPRRPAV